MVLLNRGVYRLYLVGLGVLAVLLLLAGGRLPGLGGWVVRSPGLYLLAVGGLVMGLAYLPFLGLFLVLGWLVRTARRACARIGAGDLEGGRGDLARLAWWTPRLRWMMLDPAQVESMKALVCGLVPSADALRPPAEGSPSGAPAGRGPRDGPEPPLARGKTPRDIPGDSGFTAPPSSPAS